MYFGKNSTIESLSSGVAKEGALVAWAPLFSIAKLSWGRQALRFPIKEQQPNFSPAIFAWQYPIGWNKFVTSWFFQDLLKKSPREYQFGVVLKFKMAA